MTTSKSASKTTKKTVAKKSAVKAVKIDLKTLEVGGSEIANCLGVTTGNVTGLCQSGTISKNENGKYYLEETIRSYCRAMRERKSGDSKSELDIETARWKLENIKAKNRDWRMQRDREIALEIIRALTNAMTEFREQAKLNPALVDAIDEMISKIGSVDVDGISQIVEGGDEDDDE